MANTKRKTEQARVWIVWSPNGDLDNVRTLAYHGGNGDDRVYDRDGYDSRAGNADGTLLPYFRFAREAIAFLVANPGKVCQVDTRTNIFS
jgi:hypothetical protein